MRRVFVQGVQAEGSDVRFGLLVQGLRFLGLGGFTALRLGEVQD